MKSIGVFVLCLVLAVAFAEKEEPKKEKAIESNTKLEPTADDTDEENIRKKKHTTTFCLEIRPSNPEHAPFQLCENEDYGASQSAPSKPYPAPAKPYAAPAPPAPSYGVPAKATATSSSSSSSAAAAYGASKGYNSHSYTSTYRAEDAMDEQNTEEAHAEDDEHSMRSSYGSADYGVAPITYVNLHPSLKEKLMAKKHHEHNGVVITCQPALAGYAATVPQGYGGPSHSYASYRSSTPSYNRPLYSSYKPQPGYGGMHHGYAPQGYRPVPNYKSPIYSRPSYSAPSAYKPAPSYSAPSYSAPAPAYKPAPSYSAPSYSVHAPAYKAPSPSYKSPSSSYSAPSQSYSAPTPSYSGSASSYNGGSASSYNGASTSSYSGSASSYNAPAPSYNAPAPSYNAPASSYSAPAPSYSAPAPSYNAPASSYSAPAPSYSAPAPSYNAPASSYSAPTPSYSAPAPSYNAPAPEYHPPKTYTSAPAPAPTYSAPEYVAPVVAPSYNAPEPAYTAPAYPAASSSYREATKTEDSKTEIKKKEEHTMKHMKEIEEKVGMERPNWGADDTNEERSSKWGANAEDTHVGSGWNVEEGSMKPADTGMRAENEHTSEHKEDNEV